MNLQESVLPLHETDGCRTRGPGRGMSTACCRQCGEACLGLLAPPRLVAYYQGLGACVVTPGWLARWRDILANAAGGEFLGPSGSRVVLLDTGVRDDSAKHLEELCTVLGVPGEVVPIGLDYLREKLGRRRLEHLVVEERRRAHEEEALSAGRLADLTVDKARTYAELAATLEGEVAERHQQEQFLAAILDNTHVGIIACNAEGRLMFFNRYARELHGRGLEPLAPEAWSEHYSLFHGDGRTLMQMEDVPLFRALRGYHVVGQEMVIASADGVRRTVQASGRPITSAGGVVTGAVVVLHDMTDSLALEVRLRHAQKLEAVGQLAAGVAHEVNTPAQLMRSNLEYLQHGMRDVSHLMSVYREAFDLLAEPDTELAARIRQAEDEADMAYFSANAAAAMGDALEGVKRITAIVSAMTTFAHVDRPEQVPADLNEIIRSLLTVAHNEYSQVADVELHLGDLPLVPCSPGDLGQVLLHLLRNATHAITDGGGEPDCRGRIVIRTAVDGQQVRIQIADDGCGIPPEFHPHVFEPFFTTRAVGNGAGQGLTLARSIVVNGSRGTIDFESEVGVGTTFTVMLPLEG